MSPATTTATTTTTATIEFVVDPSSKQSKYVRINRDEEQQPSILKTYISQNNNGWNAFCNQIDVHLNMINDAIQYWKYFMYISIPLCVVVFVAFLVLGPARNGRDPETGAIIDDVESNPNQILPSEAFIGVFALFTISILSSWYMIYRIKLASDKAKIEIDQVCVTMTSKTHSIITFKLVHRDNNNGNNYWNLMFRRRGLKPLIQGVFNYSIEATIRPAEAYV